jgi:drug/metabolite transporter (DMT)-like permease
VTFRLGTGERWALVAATSYTIVNITLRVAAVSIDPFIGSALRQLPVAALAFAVLAVRRDRQLLPGDPGFIGWHFLRALLLGGFLAFLVGNVLYFLGLAEAGLGITVSASQAGVVFAGLLLGLAFLRERPRREQWLGSGIIGAGLAFVALAQLGTPGATWWVGLIFAGVAGACYASTNVLTRFVQRARPALFVVLAGTSLGGLVPLLAVILVQAAATGGAAFATLTWATVGVVLLAGVFNTVALIGLTQAMAHATVATTNTISSSQLVFSFVASVLLFSEVGSPAMILGVVLVMGGIIVAQVDRSNGRARAPVVGPVQVAPAEDEPVASVSRTPPVG